MIGAVAVVMLGAHVAAGIVVDAGASVDARAVSLSAQPLDPTAPPDAEPTAPPPDASLVLRPKLGAAIADREGAVLTLSYLPQISFDSTAPKNVPFYALQMLDARGQLPIGRRFSLRAFANGAYGALDPASAQAALVASNSASAASFVAAPYATGSVGAGMTAHLLRTLSLDVDASAQNTQSPGGIAASIIPTTTSGIATAALEWQLDRPDAFLVGGDARGATVDKRGSFSGYTPQIGWRRDLGPGTGIDVRGGYGVFQTSLSDALVWEPTLDAKARAAWLLGGGTALDAVGGFGLTVVNDPLGALLENRASAGLAVGLRLDHAWSLHAATDAFTAVPGSRIGVPKKVVLSDFTANNRVSVAWALVDRLAIEMSVIATTRLTQGFLGTDMTVAVSLTGTMPVWHSGGRPPGSDPRPGRDIGELPIGVPPPPGSTTIEEPEPLPEFDEEPDQAPPPPPEHLAAPPPNKPILEQPLTPEALKKEKHKKAKKGDKGSDSDDDGKPAAKPDASSGSGSGSGSSSSKSSKTSDPK